MQVFHEVLVCIYQYICIFASVISFFHHMSKFRIKNIAAARGISMRELAKRMGITAQTLGNILREGNSPNVSTLERIAAVLEVPVSALFTDYLTAAPASGIVCPYCGGKVGITTATRRQL